MKRKQTTSSGSATPPSEREHAATAFNGFPRGAFDFFARLAGHNNRDWFHAHQDVYERACREPMKTLVAELGGNPEQTKITRINRDLRFSPDKSPYRTYIAAGVRGYYVSLSATGLWVGTGMYKPEPPALERLRNAIASDTSGPTLQRIVTSLRRKGYHVDTHDRLASTPRGYSMDHPRIALLQMKDIFAGKELAPEPWLSTPKALQRIRRVMDDTRPFAEWLRDYVGARQ